MEQHMSVMLPRTALSLACDKRAGGGQRDSTGGRSDSRSDSRDSGLGKDSEIDSGGDRNHRRTPMSPPSHHSHVPGAYPSTNSGSPAKSPGFNSSTESFGSLGSQRHSPGAQERPPHGSHSPSRSRSRSRSPVATDTQQQHDDKTDKYSNYDRHFKKKFFGRQKTPSSPNKSSSSPSSEGRYGKFHPKGKNWEKNQAKYSSGCASVSGKCAPTSESPSKLPLADWEESHSCQADGGSESTQAHRNLSQRPRSPSAIYHTSRPSTPIHCPPQPPPSQTRSPPSTPGSTHSAPNSAGLFSGSTSGRSSVPSATPVRPTAELPHANASFAELAAQSALSQAGFTGTAAHQLLTETLARQHLLAAGAGLLAPHQFDLDPQRLAAMCGEFPGPRPGFGVSFGGPATFRPPFSTDFSPSQPSLLAEYALVTRAGFGDTSARPTFGSDAQIFSPLGHHGKEKGGWKTFSSSSGSKP